MPDPGWPLSLLELPAGIHSAPVRAWYLLGGDVDAVPEVDQADPYHQGVDYPDHDRTVRLWNVRTMRPITTLGRHRGTVSGVAFHPDGTHLASAGFDMTVRLWPISPDSIHASPGQPSSPTRRRHLFARRYRPPGAATG